MNKLAPEFHLESVVDHGILIVFKFMFGLENRIQLE